MGHGSLHESTVQLAPPQASSYVLLLAGDFLAAANSWIGQSHVTLSVCASLYSASTA
jgi:hypothetical protein